MCDTAYRFIGMELTVKVLWLTLKKNASYSTQIQGDVSEKLKKNYTNN